MGGIRSPNPQVMPGSLLGGFGTEVGADYFPLNKIFCGNEWFPIAWCLKCAPEGRRSAPSARGRAAQQVKARVRLPEKTDGHGMSSECSLKARFSVQTTTAPFRPNETSTHPSRYTWNGCNSYSDVEMLVHVSLRDTSFTKPCANQSGSLHPDLHL